MVEIRVVIITKVVDGAGGGGGGGGPTIVVTMTDGPALVLDERARVRVA